MRIGLSACLVAALGAVCCDHAVAADDSSLVVTDGLVRALHLCIAERDGPRRLACYDQAVQRPGKVPTPEQSFGLTAAQVLQQEQVPQGPKNLTAQVVAVSRRPQGPLRLTLANGQVWVEQSSDGNDLSIKVGDSVTLTRGVLGSFMLTSSESGNRSVRVTRLK